METLAEFFETGVYVFMLIFMRIGTAMMLFPGIGDTYTPVRVRLFLGLGLTLVLFPLLSQIMPSEIPGTFAFFILLFREFMLGAFIGIVARILLMALDTAGMLVSLQAGLSNAQLFNPALATQGSIIGAFFVITGTMLIFVTDLHHLMIYGLVNSYEIFPVGAILPFDTMGELVTKAVATAFYTGISVAAPFLVVTLLLYIGMGVLARLMPQVQVFLLAIPVQILLSFTVMAVGVVAGLTYWLSFYEQGIRFFFGG